MGRDDLILLNECREKGLSVPFQEFLNLATLYRIQHRLKDKRIGHRAAQESQGIEWEGVSTQAMLMPTTWQS